MSLRRHIRVTTPPASEPVTVAEAKLWLKVDGDDDDDLLTGLIAAAREAAESFTGRAFITQAVTLTLDLGCSGWANELPDGVYDLPVSALYGALPRIISLSRPPVSAITSVTTTDTTNTATAFSSANYTLDAAGSRLLLNDGSYWPTNLRPAAAISVLTANGYGATGASVPQPIRHAILMHVASMYESRLVCDLPAACRALLQPFKVYGEV
ncbi:phage head-tail connector protein [Gemmata sp. G18]|uniref:Phage head-tail connector protein n=1 Tax=Gemmata palustris TaxID=2822762 RepID=A0ABS5BXB0_9BACT|nr:head-tail connector protein [Gemmata palustris]MBP3958346.1 phage head-tail connector protein [Gemmata palustris]